MGALHGSSPELVSPRVVLERYASVTGLMDFAPSTYPDGQYGAALTVRGAIFPADGNVADCVLARDSRLYHAAIGNYDPAQDRWLLAPEYVLSDEQPALAAAYHDFLGPSGAPDREKAKQMGRSVIDVFNEFTGDVRREMAAAMVALSPEEFLFRRRSNGEPCAFRPVSGRMDPIPNEGVAYDEASFCFPIIGQDLRATLLRDAAGNLTGNVRVARSSPQMLGIIAAGLHMAVPDGSGHTSRQGAIFHVASRNPGGGPWIPNLENVGVDEWEAIWKRLPYIMKRAQQKNPNFSLAAGAIAYNMPR